MVIEGFVYQLWVDDGFERCWWWQVVIKVVVVVGLCFGLDCVDLDFVALVIGGGGNWTGVSISIELIWVSVAVALVDSSGGGFLIELF